MVAAALGLWFLFVYNGCNYVAAQRTGVASLYFEWERHYPFVPELIVPYWSMDLFFMLAPFLCATRFLLWQHSRRVFTGIAVAGVFFLLFPLQLAWPRPAVTGPLGKLFSSLEVWNNFYNCCPSLHIVLRTVVWEIFALALSGWSRTFLAGWFFLITLSTLLCWQHYAVDVFTGQLLGLLCLQFFPSQPLARPPVDKRLGINSDGRLALRYAAGSLALLGLCLAGWPYSVPLLWPVLSLAVVSLAYAGSGPWLLGKWRGRLLPASSWLLRPYLLGAEWLQGRLNAGYPAFVELLPGLWLGRRLTPEEAERMPAPAVLDLTAEFSETPALLQRTYRNVAILDLTAPAPEQLREAVAFLEENPRCYVHCALGLGRTWLVGAAWLIHRGTPLDHALALVEKACPRIRLRPAQRQALERFSEGYASSRSQAEGWVPGVSDCP